MRFWPGSSFTTRACQATDPLSGRVISPPNARGVDEATGWFLDYFSPRELRRFLKEGARAPVRDVAIVAFSALAVSVAAAILAIERMGGASSDPGAITSLSVVTAGFALAIFLFHMLRFGPARRLASGAISPAMVRAHLNDAH